MHVQVVQKDAPTLDAPKVLNLQTSSSDDAPTETGFDRARAQAVAEGDLPPQPQAAPAQTAKPATVVKDAFEKTPRNAPCPCGSGKKFKNCHGAA
jgi:preprotein translocase subunit SecA